MRYGSVDGQSLFPLVILAIKADSAAAVSFKHCSSLVPYHQFLPWVNQLVSYSNTSPAVASLLVAIAAEYPAHVRTPLGITRSNLHSACLATDAFKSLELNLPIDSTWEMFLKSIVYLYPPEKAAAEFLNSGIMTLDISENVNKCRNLIGFFLRKLRRRFSSLQVEIPSLGRTKR